MEFASVIVRSRCNEDAEFGSQNGGGSFVCEEMVRRPLDSKVSGGGVLG